MERSLLYEKAANDISAIAEASKPTDVLDDSEGEVIQNPKENKPPLSTKHATQPEKLFHKEASLSPVNNAQKNGLIKNPTTTRLKSKIQLMPKGAGKAPVKVVGLSNGGKKENKKKNITPIRKLK